jgi:glucose-1-phosphate adenylyltransferase
LNTVKAIILGGGRGSRLFPLTLTRAKPAVSFAGKYRLIDIPISNCINSGIKRVFVLTQFLSASMHRHIMQTYQFDTFTDGFVDILAAEQTPQGEDWFQGTADAVRATLNHTTYYKADQVLILSGDHLYRMDYSDLIQHHRDSKAEITIGVYPVTREEAPRMGLLGVDDAGMVEEFVEKPQDPAVLERFRAPRALFEARGIDAGKETYLASMGIYVFDPEVLLDVLSDRAKTDFGKDVIPAAVGQLRISAYPFAGFWQDIGTIRSFFDANIAMAQAEAPFDLYKPLWPIYTRSRSLPPSRIIRSDIRDSLIVEGSDISGASITDSIIGVRSMIRENTRLKDVVMNGADFYEGEQILFGGEEREGDDVPPLGIGSNCVIERAIIDKNARIGDGVTILAQPEGTPDYKGDSYWIRDGITIILKGAVIPPGTKI